MFRPCHSDASRSVDPGDVYVSEWRINLSIFLPLDLLTDQRYGAGFREDAKSARRMTGPDSTLYLFRSSSRNNSSICYVFTGFLV